MFIKYFSSIGINRQIIILFLSLLILIMTFISSRFYNIHQVGVPPGDGHEYIEAGQEWSRGNIQFFRKGYFRPGGHFLYGVILSLFDNPTVSLKVFNACLDFLTFVALIVMVFLATQNILFSLVAGLLYISLWEAIYYARSEFVHSTVAFFLTLSLLLFTIAYYRKKGSSFCLITLSGASLGYGSLVHPSIALIGANFFLFILINNIIHKWGNINISSFKLFSIFRECFFFSIGYFFWYFLCIVIYGPSFVFYNITHDIIIQHEFTSTWGPQDGHNIFNTVYQVIFTGFNHSFHSSLAGLFFVFYIILLGAIFTKLKPFFKLYLLFLISIPLIFSISFYFSSHGFESSCFRLITHVLPVVVLFVAIISARSAQLFKKRFQQFLVYSLLLLTIIAGFASYPIRSWISYQNLYKPNVYQWVYTLLKDKVDEDNRLLITPYIFYSNDNAFGRDYYFGDNAFYIRHFKWRSGVTLNKLFQDNNIRYLFFSNVRYDKRLLSDKVKKREGIDFYGFRLKGFMQYSVEKEKNTISSYLNNIKANVLSTSDMGTIYQLY